MVGARVNDSSSLNILLPSDTLHSSPAEMFESLWMPSSSTPFHGSHSMVSYDSVHEANATDGSFFQPIEKDENGEGEEELDVCFQQPGKKRRLSVDQVQFLEKNFEVENKLEPERKLQLAKELGLQPRQVAIWFQNRRARFKTKQLEKDYGGLKTKYDGLKSDYDCIQRENEKLNSEITSLKEKLKLRDQERKNSQLYCDEQINSKLKKPKSTSGLEKEPRLVARLCKFEDASSAKSDVMDSDSPNYRNNSPPLLEPADSSNMFGTEQSDEEENLSKNLLPPSSCFPKIEDCYYHDQPPVTTSSCNFGYSAEEQPFWFSPYE